MMRAIATVAITILVVVTLLVVGSVEFCRYIQRQQCDGFAAQSGRVTKFVEYGFWGGNDCLTPRPDGTWISAYNLRGLV